MSDVVVTEQTRVNIAIKVEEESWGEIQLKFFPDLAPNHVRNMVTSGSRFILRWDHLPSRYPRVYDPRG